MKSHCARCPVLTTGFFASLGPPSKKIVSCLMVYGRYKKRQILYHEGNPANRVYALKSGLVKTYKTDSKGKEQLMGFVKAGEVFNLENLHNGQCTVTAEVVADAEACYIEGQRLLDVMANNPTLALEVIRLLSKALALSQDQVLYFGTKSAKARLAAFLLGFMPANTRTAGPITEIEIPVTRREIADLLGVTLETISRLFRLLREGRVADANGRQVKITDPARLRALAE